MTKAEQPTITQEDLADKLQNLLNKSDAAFIGQMMLLYGDVFVAALRHRTTSLAAQDGLVDALGDALFNLSAKLNEAGFLKDDANHAAYEKVVAAFNGVSAIKGDKS